MNLAYLDECYSFTYLNFCEHKIRFDPLNHTFRIRGHTELQQWRSRGLHDNTRFRSLVTDHPMLQTK